MGSGHRRDRHASHDLLVIATRCVLPHDKLRRAAVGMQDDGGQILQTVFKRRGRRLDGAVAIPAGCFILTNHCAYEEGEMRYLVLALLLTGCASNGVPKGASAWCGSFEYTGTWLKAETDGRAIGLSDAALAERMTVEQVIALAEAMGCSH